jgi:Holliday junction resolvasome RuvABC endonuclease subunit
MGLGSLAKKKANRVIGIDCSTKSVAFACFEGDRLVFAGEFKIPGNTFYERLANVRKVTEAVWSHILSEFEDVGFIAFETAIVVNSARTVIELSYFYGTVISVLLESGAEVFEVAPITWQSHIGNPNLKAHEKQAIKDANPGKSVNWYKNAGRLLRKQRTLDWAKDNYGIETDSDNTGDAVGVAYYAATVLTGR